MHELVPEDFGSDPLVSSGRNGDRDWQGMVRRQFCRYVCYRHNVAKNSVEELSQLVPKGLTVRGQERAAVCFESMVRNTRTMVRYGFKVGRATGEVIPSSNIADLSSQ
jgi:hypothetical protein